MHAMPVEVLSEAEESESVTPFQKTLLVSGHGQGQEEFPGNDRHLCQILQCCPGMARKSGLSSTGEFG